LRITLKGPAGPAERNDCTPPAESGFRAAAAKRYLLPEMGRRGDEDMVLAVPFHGAA